MLHHVGAEEAAITAFCIRRFEPYVAPLSNAAGLAAKEI